MNDLNPQQREDLRVAMLEVLEANATRHGLGIVGLAFLVKRFGFEPTNAQVLAEMTYLEDRHLVVCLDKVISPENKFWRITAAGRDFLAERTT